MARPSIDTDIKAFVSHMPRKAPVGNITLRSELGWSDSRYWRVHSTLVTEGMIRKGRGKGGSVILAGRGNKKVN